MQNCTETSTSIQYQFVQYLLCPFFAFIAASVLFGRLAVSFQRDLQIYYFMLFMNTFKVLSQKLVAFSASLSPSILKHVQSKLGWPVDCSENTSSVNFFAVCLGSLSFCGMTLLSIRHCQKELHGMLRFLYTVFISIHNAWDQHQITNSRCCYSTPMVVDMVLRVLH